MVHIDYKLNISGHHGMGLYADQDIKKGELVYSASPLLDLDITQEQFDDLADGEKQEIMWWGFFNKSSQKWHVDFDVSKFINHSYDASVTQQSDYDEAYLIATRDIESGEEITQNYLEFESKEDLERRGIKA
jgi:SET domain-containing protein